MEPRAAVLKSSFDLAHMVFNAVVSDLAPEHAVYDLPGGTVPRPAAVIAHLLFGEDMMVSQASAGGLVLESGAFGVPTGISAPQPSMTPEWLAQTFDIDGLRAYAAAVFARTNEFLESADAAAMDRRLPSPIGGPEVSAAEYLGGFGVVHVAQHTGEISALKGAQGLKGLPF